MPKGRVLEHKEEAKWGHHKETLRQLYIVEKIPLEGPDGVVEKMKERYSFDKLPRQYQDHFKQWKFRKNRHGVEWEIIGRKIAARKEAGKDSVVCLEGNELPDRTVDRQTYRNGYGTAFKPYNQGPIPKTPEGFVLLTPIPDDRELFLTSNLPFVEFQTAIHLHETLFAFPDDSENTGHIHSSQHISRHAYFSSSKPIMVADRVPLSESSQAIELHQKTAKMHDSIVIPTLRSLLPTTVMEEYSQIGSRELPPIENLHRAHLKLLCFSVANNFAGTTGFSLKMIWEYVRRQISIPRLMQLAPGPTTKALAEKLFICAIESGDVEAVEYFLQRQYVDANEQICIIKDFRYTPIERSAKLQNIPMIKVLIYYNANVNKTYAQSGNEKKGALEHAIIKCGRTIHADPTLIQILAECGAKFSDYTLGKVIRSGNSQVAEILFRKGACDNHEIWIKKGMLNEVVEHLDRETAARLIQLMVLFKANINYKRVRYHRGKFDGTVLDRAAEKGHLSIVQMLLDYGAFLTEGTLMLAIHSTNMDLVWHLLHEGANIDSCVYIDNRYKTPYSEAIRTGNTNLVQLLEDRGALGHITEEKRFGAAVCAASQIGNVKILQSLIQKTASNREVSLSYALREACAAGWEEAALLLIDAGAYINTDNALSGDSSALYDALNRKNGNLVRALLNYDIDASRHSYRNGGPLTAAARWGDHSIIKDLIFAGARSSEKAILVAVEKKDIELIRLLLNIRAVGGEGLDASVKSALEVAVSKGDIDLVLFLFEEGADANDSRALFEATSQNSDLLHLLLVRFAARYPRGRKGYGSKALFKAIREADGPLLETLLNGNADVHGFYKEGGFYKTPLALAIEKENVAIVQRFLDKVLDLNDIVSFIDRQAYSNTGPPRLTALLVAVCTKNPQIVQLLINKGADVNFAATRGVKLTPLQMAAKIGSLEIVQVLIRNGAEVNAQPAMRGGATALQCAAIGGFIGIAEELLKRGADVNAAPSKQHGRTALEGAIEHGRIDMVQFLLNVHAEFESPGHPGYERAMNSARKNGHRAVAEMLESYSQSRQNARAGYILSEDDQESLSY